MRWTFTPYYNVSTVYGLSSATSPFVGLGSAPHDWTTAISYTTASFGLGIEENTSSNLDIVVNGNVWFPSNQTGAVGLGYFSPSSTAFNGPYGGTGLTHPQYVAIDQSAYPVAFTTDLQSSTVTGTETTLPGTYLSYTSSLFTTGGPLALDNANNVLLAGNGTSNALYVLSSARSAVALAKYTYSGISGTYTPPAAPNGLVVALGSAYTADNLFTTQTVSTNVRDLEYHSHGSYIQEETLTQPCITGGLAYVANSNYNAGFAPACTGSIFLFDSLYGFNDEATVSSLSTPKGIAYDGLTRLWVANSGNASVAPLDTSEGVPTAIGTGYLHGTSYGATLTTPYEIAIDRSGNVWTSNASCVSTTTTACAASGFTLSETVGAAGPTITPLSAQEAGTGALSGTRPTN